ncbi:hypothetical protein PV325_002072 [Microctonus aethiopoides]|uniref:Uncharacterized protein n=1 Tax=Microctonus aethiopoides TaxID=144406 RepID=A0AA39FVH8_9HYME|nr:hypothetical protein PV326_011342 [Microctonus aethiopoides]KAK0078819.1 hypothetical protein PV325_002072 [Microctonus aethiopoides]KAK0176346.1 hypothetical protein PV328_000491 [Microctonus aethiopoides]
MAGESSKDCNKEFLIGDKLNSEQLKFGEMTQSTIKASESIKENKGSHVRISKVKSKYTLRTKSLKRVRVSNIKDTNNRQEVLPYIPRKVFRVLTMLRHEKFLKLITRFFKPTSKKTLSWNFDIAPNKTSK